MTWITWIPRLLAFGAWYAYDLVVSNVTVIGDNVTPGQRSTPGIAVVPTQCRTEFEITLLAALITLAPGTLAIGAAVKEDPDVGVRRILDVHGMYNDDADGLRAEIWDLERRMLKGIRRKGDVA